MVPRSDRGAMRPGRLWSSSGRAGLLAIDLVPHGAQPRKVAMLVLVQVSSMKTRRSGSNLALICPLLPLRAPAGDVRTVAFAGDDAFF